MDFITMEVTRLQETATVIKSSSNTIKQSFNELRNQQQMLSHWQGLGATFLTNQFLQLGQYFERQNQVIQSYQLVLNNCISQSHLQTEKANLALASQIK